MNVLTITLFLSVIVLLAIFFWYRMIYKKTKGKGIKSFILTDGIYQYKGVAILAVIIGIVGIILIVISNLQ